MKFDGNAIYPPAIWCNYRIAHLIHNTPEPCSTNTFIQQEYPTNYKHNVAKLKLDCFNFIGDPEVKQRFLRLMENRKLVEYSLTMEHTRVHYLLFEFPTLQDKTVPCRVIYKRTIENNGSEDFELSVQLPVSIDNQNEWASFSAVYKVNAYDGKIMLLSRI